MSSTNNTPLESEALLQIFYDLEKFHIGVSTIMDGQDLTILPSFLASKLLYDAERDVLSTDVALFENDTDLSDMNFLAPLFEITRFPYVVEDRDFSRTSINQSAQLNDLSTEIEKRELSALRSSARSNRGSSPSLILFSNTVFPESFEHHMRRFQRENDKGNAVKNMRSIIHAFQNIRENPARGRWNEGHEDDDDEEDGGYEVKDDEDDEEDEDDDFDDEDEDDDDVDDDNDDEYGEFDLDDSSDVGSNFSTSSVERYKLSSGIAHWDDANSFHIFIDGDDEEDTLDEMLYLMENLGNGRIHPRLSDEVNRNLDFGEDFFDTPITCKEDQDFVTAPSLPSGQPFKPPRPDGGDSSGGGATIKLRDEDDSSS